MERANERMNARKIRGLFNQVRQTAARFAEKCDFVAAEEIRKAEASCYKDTAYVSALYKDRVERVQIFTSFSYACGLLGVNLSSSAAEDITAEHGKRYMIITLSFKSCKTTKEGEETWNEQTN